MPILKPEIHLQPPDLLASPPTEVESRRWWVVATRPRQEKSLARELVVRAAPFYLPLVKRITHSGGKRRTSYSPLFAGYLFLFATADERTAALATNRIVSTLEVDDQDLLAAELLHLETLIAGDAPVTLEKKLSPGRAVRIKSGSMEGTEGVVVTRRGADRLVVAVTMLQQGVSIEIEDFQVEPIY